MPQHCSASRLDLMMLDDNNMVEESIGIATVVQKSKIIIALRASHVSLCIRVTRDIMKRETPSRRVTQKIPG
jgi:hypothetical protein